MCAESVALWSSLHRCLPGRGAGSPPPHFFWKKWQVCVSLEIMLLLSFAADLGSMEGSAARDKLQKLVLLLSLDT